MEIKHLAHEAREGLRSARGRNVLTFLIFLFISTIFWFLLALNDDIQKDFTVPVELEDFPSNYTILSGYNPVLNLTIKDKGSDLMKYSWGKKPVMKLRLSDFTRTDDSTLIISASKLHTAIRNEFGTGGNIVSLRPDSLKISYTTNPGIKVAVNVRTSIHTEPQYAYAGHLVLSTDSVTLYSSSPDRFNVHVLSTPLVSLNNLTDSTTLEVKLETPRGMRAIPSTIRITVPVEPLVAKHQTVALEALNVPNGSKVVTFPAMIEVSYLIPKSLYNKAAPAIKATVDYNDINRSGNTLPVSVSALPAFYRSVAVSPQQVEYVVERAD